MSDEQPTEGRRVGIHPLIVVFGIILGLWIFIALIIPQSKNIKAPGSGATPSAPLITASPTSHEVVPTFQTTATIADMNAMTLLVPPATTDSQVIALLLYLKSHQHDGQLGTILPPTTPGNKSGEFAIADIYIFSDAQYAVEDSARALSRGAHAPGEFYPSSIPYEVAMEQVRGHYAVDLYNRNQPESASLGFGEDATGVYSKRFQRVF